MTIEEDREEFNGTGLRGMLQDLMKSGDEGFVRELPDGWRGEAASERPAPGSGPYLHYRQGYAVLRYDNEHSSDQRFSEYKVFV